jgi:hypothetical protein
MIDKFEKNICNIKIVLRLIQFDVLGVSFSCSKEFNVCLSWHFLRTQQSNRKKTDIS